MGCFFWNIFFKKRRIIIIFSAPLNMMLNGCLSKKMKTIAPFKNFSGHFEKSLGRKIEIQTIWVGDISSMAAVPERKRAVSALFLNIFCSTSRMDMI